MLQNSTTRCCRSCLIIQQGRQLVQHLGVSSCSRYASMRLPAYSICECISVCGSRGHDIDTIQPTASLGIPRQQGSALAICSSGEHPKVLRQLLHPFRRFCGWCSTWTCFPAACRARHGLVLSSCPSVPVAQCARRWHVCCATPASLECHIEQGMLLSCL